MTSIIGERLDQLHEVLSSDKFLSKKGLGNELAFYIFDYEAECEPLVEAYLPTLKSLLSQKSPPRIALEINLYGLIIELLEARGYLHKSFHLEANKGSEALEKGIGRIVRTDNLLELIRQKLEPMHDLVFLTGVGAAWPLVRSHTILNNLHAQIDTVPLVMFYPGRYSGKDLSLFAKFSDDNYYRAFSLLPRPDVGI